MQSLSAVSAGLGAVVGDVIGGTGRRVEQLYLASHAEDAGVLARGIGVDVIHVVPGVPAGPLQVLLLLRRVEVVIRLLFRRQRAVVFVRAELREVRPQLIEWK